MIRRLNQPAVRLLLLYLAGLVALLGGLGSLAGQVGPGGSPAGPGSSPTGSSPTDSSPTTAAPASARAAAPFLARQRQNLVVLGDSVPAATACDCPGFGTELARSVQPAQLVNAAVPGLTSQGLLVQLDSPAVIQALREATVVTVTVGANDFDTALADQDTCAQASCYGPELRDLDATMGQIAGRLAALVQPSTKVILTGYWNVFLDGRVGAERGPAYVATSDALTREVNAAVARAAAGAHQAYADLYSPFKGDGSRDDTGLLAADGDHPDAAGHALIAAVIATTAGLSTLQ